MGIRVQKSLWPLDRDPGNPMEGFNEWHSYIRNELKKTKVIHIDPVLEQQILDARGKLNTLLMAKKILKYGNRN